MKNIGTSEDNTIPETKPHGNLREGVSDETIYALKEQRFSNEAISEYYKKQGITISVDAIGRRVRIIYAKKGKRAPRGKNRNKSSLEDLESKIQSCLRKKEESKSLVEEFEKIEAESMKIEELEK